VLRVSNNTASSPRFPQRIPSLDGLRALSIILVLAGHLRGTRGAPVFLNSKIDVGYLGVRMFFVISGFIITHLLLKKECNGGISIGQFWIRRSLRIFPSAYTYMLTILLASLIGLVAINGKDLVSAATYTINWRRDPAWLLGHLWSLSVEEQFYLLWPLVMRSLGSRQRLNAALGVMIFSPVLRCAILLFLPAETWRINYSFPTVADALATGCALALLQDPLRKHLRYARFQRSAALPLLIAGSLLFSVLSTKLNMLIGMTLLNTSIALTIDWCIQNHRSVIGRILNNVVLVQIGLMSYSIYLWQQPFLNRQAAAWFNAFPQNIACALTVAAISYFLIEKPFMASGKYSAAIEVWALLSGNRDRATERPVT